MTLLEAMELPDEFIHPERHLCGLCGNHGIIDTVGKMFSPAGVECGVRVPCVCANGRAIKHGTAKKTRQQKKYKSFWVSWDDYSWKDPSRPGPRIISYWESGQAMSGAYTCIVAWVAATTIGEVVEAIDRDWPSKKERRWRFINPCAPDFSTGDRFPLDEAAKKKLKQFKIRLGRSS